MCEDLNNAKRETCVVWCTFTMRESNEARGVRAAAAHGQHKYYPAVCVQKHCVVAQTAPWKRIWLLIEGSSQRAWEEEVGNR